MHNCFRCVALFLCAIVFASIVFGQDEDDVVKITSRLVQVDAVVTDKDGRQVTDLTADDFQIFQDGKLQKISGFSYVPLGAQNAAGQKSESKSNVPLTSPRRSSTGVGAGRVITFVVDDGNCRVSISGIRATREALEKFLSEQMLPDDLVAIYQTRSGSSMFQQYTSDKTRLLRTVRKLRWYPNAGGCPASDGSYFDAARVNTFSIPTTTGVKSISEETAEERDRRQTFEDRNRDHQVSGTLGVMRYALSGLGRLPGRKVMFLMSDGLPYRARNNELLQSMFYFRDVTELANRAAVVINSIDVRGDIDSSMIEARDDVSTLGDPLGTEKIVQDRRRQEINTQDGLAFLANETGGQFFRNQNYLDGPLAKAMLIEKGYYLVAYEPDGDTFKGKNFNKVEIRVSRPGLKVHSRAGFMGVIDQDAKKIAKTGDSELYEAIVAPLPNAGLDLALTAHFANTPAEGSIVRSLVHLLGSDITFTDEPDGTKKAVVDVVAVTMDEKNQVVDEFTRTHTFKIPVAALPLFEKNGLMYAADVKVKRPGYYTYRVALRDVNSKRIGTASRQVEVPDLKRNKLFVSGLVATEVDTQGKFASLQPVDPNAAIAIPPTLGAPGIRTFRKGSVIAYAYQVYNAKITAGGKPNLTVEMNLYFDGKLIVDGAPQPADLQPHQDWSRISDFGYMKLNPTISSGDYILEVIVRDVAAGKKVLSSQTTDFQVVD